jgi:hypothetical protein
MKSQRPLNSQSHRPTGGRPWRFLHYLGASAAAFIAACSTNNHIPPGPIDPIGAGGQRDASAPGDPCAMPGHFGCPCEETGASVDCGKVVERAGDYVTCSMGRSTCDGQTWGPCIGDHYALRSLPGAGFGASGLVPMSTNVPCTNVCDPNECSSIASGGSDVDAAGLSITDAGVSILPNEASVGGGPCKGLWCQVAACDGGKKTSLSGTVYDPAGKNPLYNAFVYIPVDPTASLPAFTSGASCDTCAGAGTLSAIAVAQTGADGKFTLNNVPSGSNVPLVVQMGKWRRKVTLSSVNACVDNAVPKDSSRLPRNRFDGDGNAADIPKMAIASGDADPFECLLVKAGIDAAEIDLPSKGSRIDFYKLNGVDRSPGGAPAGGTLTSSLTTLKKYDVVLLPCEGYENDSHNADAPNLVQYADAGGRIFTTHYGYAWLATPNSKVAQNLTAFYGTANWKLDTWDFNDPMTGNVDQSFPKGAAFAQWLVNVGASSTLGKMTVNEPRHDAKSAINPPSQRWMYGNSASSSSADMLLSMTFNTPVAASAANQCGRVVFSDFHVSADALVSGNGTCTSDNDCGVTAVCAPPVVGTCTDQTCTTKSDCDLSGSTCSAPVKGACTPALCIDDNDCQKGKCVTGKCNCKKDLHCGSGTCNAGVCAPFACFDQNDCGKSEVCAGGAKGTCAKTCATDADCGGGTKCLAGLCKGCITDNDCPGSSTTCAGGKAGGCSLTGSMFPLTCRNGDLSAQEKALEFMLFDLTACVSPDTFVPPAPTIQFNPVTFTQDYAAVCGKGKRAVWREFDWQHAIPGTASIDYSAQTADTAAGLATARSVTIGHMTTSTPVPSWDVAILDAKTTGLFKTVSPPVVSQALLRVTITLNPTADKKASPRLLQWKVQYDCVDAE